MYVYIFFFRFFAIMCYYKILSRIVVKLSSRVQLFATLWTIVRQAPLSMEFPGQEYCSGLPFPSPADLPHPGIKPLSPALAGGFFTAEPPGKPIE